MESTSTERPRRSLVRRLTLPILALLIALGGGAGWYLTQGTQTSETTPDTAAEDVAQSVPTATDELKSLFAREASASTNQADAETLFETEDFSAEVPNEEQSASTFETDTTTSNTMPTDRSDAQTPISSQNFLGDRYANITPQATIPAESSPPESEPAVVEVEEVPLVVTRGQDPSINPLRAPVQQVSKEEPAEENDQSDAPPASPEPEQAATPTPAPQQLFQQEPDQVSNALQNARPLEASDSATGRYASSGKAGSSMNRYEFSPPIETPLSESDENSSPATEPAREPTPADALPDNNPVPRNNAPTSEPVRNPLADAITPTPGISNTPGTGRPGEQVLEGTQSPSLTLEKLVPEEIQVGKRCTFAIRLHNNGQRTAQQVQVHDEVPLGTELIGTSPRATVNGSQVTWDLGTLSPGEERTLEMELKPVEEGQLGSVATVSFAAQASAKTLCTKPELQLRLSSEPKVHVGNQQLVQIELSNPGSGATTGVMLLESVPAGVSHEAGPALEFEVGTLQPGETRHLELVLTAEQAGQIQNVMTARADAGLQVEASCEFEVVAPKLQLSIDGPQKRYLERPATYQVSIDNPGTAPAKDVQLITHLPKGLQFVSANNLGEYDASQHSVMWSLAELPASERGTVELVTLPVEAGQQRLQATTKAYDGLEDRQEKDILVEGIAALMFEVVDLEDPIGVGTETAYEIRVVNQGSKQAANVQVTAVLPSGLRALSGKGDSRASIQADRVVFEPLKQLAPKEEANFRIQVQGTQPGDQRIRVQVTTSEIRDPITKEESTRVYSDQ